jgi:hypothetical protein
VIPGTTINLFSVDPITGTLVPALDTSGNPIAGIVDAGGLAATFTGVSHFSTIVALLPNALTVGIDIKPDEFPDVINTKSNGNITVAIFSTPTFDATKVDPSTLRLSGAPVRPNLNGKWLISTADVNGDGLVL